MFLIKDGNTEMSVWALSEADQLILLKFSSQEGSKTSCPCRKFILKEDKTRNGTHMN